MSVNRTHMINEACSNVSDRLVACFQGFQEHTAMTGSVITNTLLLLLSVCYTCRMQS